MYRMGVCLLFIYIYIYIKIYILCACACMCVCVCVCMCLYVEKEIRLGSTLPLPWPLLTTELQVLQEADGVTRRGGKAQREGGECHTPHCFAGIHLCTGASLFYESVTSTLTLFM